MPGALIQSTGGGGTLIAMSRRTGSRFREWCQYKSVLGNGVLTGVLGVLAACVVVCVRGLAVVSGWCFVS